MDGLVEAFHNSQRLHRHVAFLYEQGSVYLVHNGNLLFHGCVPLEEDGSFTEVTLDPSMQVRTSGRVYSGTLLSSVLVVQVTVRTFCANRLWQERMATPTRAQ